MRIDRRTFIAGSALTGVALTRSAQGQAQRERGPRAVLNLSSQDGRIPGETLAQKLDRMEQWGFNGLELGGWGLPDRVSEVQRALQNRKVKVSAICAGYEGALIADDPGERAKAVESIKRLLVAAGALGSTGLIVVPAFNNQTKLDNREARRILVDALPALGEVAAANKTRILLEPLNRGEAFFLRQLADGAAICRDAKHPAVCLMGDFYHMGIEETSDLGAFLSAGPYLHHVHMASRQRNLPGQDDRDYRDGFRGLKMIGYQDYCSLECGVQGDPVTEIPRSVKFMRDQWRAA